MFDWLQFLDRHGIEYTTQGPNVSRGNVAVKCPFCGVEDPSEHMAISLNGRGWACWRNRLHKGKNNARLVAALLGCTIEQARAIVKDDLFIPEDFEAMVRKNLLKDEVVDQPSLPIPEDFRSFRDIPSAKLFVAYLRRRGFPQPFIISLTKRYGVYYCKHGEFRGRIVFTVRLHKKLVTWTGRSIYPNESLRYKTLSTSDGAVHNVGHCLLWYDKLVAARHRSLVLCEGPFDALKLAYLGEKASMAATCFFTASPSDEQVGLLHTLLPKYERTFLMLDRNAEATALRVASMLRPFNLKVLFPPPGVKDPGDLNRKQFNLVMGEVRS